MKLASINLRKRANDPPTAAALRAWLAIVCSTILIIQEATAHTATLPSKLADLDLVAGNAQVACWARQGAALTAEVTAIPAVVVEASSVLICGTYLSAYSSAERVRQLHALRHLLLERSQPIVLMGDFNLAPMAPDGRYGGEESKWTSAAERAALAKLVSEIGLVDLTTCCRLGEQHFTFERINKGKWTRFRCDLAFAPDGPSFAARYDHDVRTGSHAFTDHSACIVDLGLSNAGAALYQAAPPSAIDDQGLRGPARGDVAC
jgi:exonuclease III